MHERVRFVSDVARGEQGLSELCECYTVSRKTGYKWLERYEAEGPAGLVDRSRRPHHSPTATEGRVRKRWCSCVSVTRLGRREAPEDPAQAAAEVAVAGALDSVRAAEAGGSGAGEAPSLEAWAPGPPLSVMSEPNAVWCADFKGEFKTRDGEYCYPLTVTDGFSRFLLGCQALRSTRTELAKPVFTRIFEEYGLPRVVRTDNGVPFATTALARLSHLSVWWIRLESSPS